MPSIKRRVYGLIRQLSSSATNTITEGIESDLDYPDDTDDDGQEQSFIHLYLAGRLKKDTVPEVYSGKTGVDLPVLLVERLRKKVHASYTGPEGGITQVPPIRKKPVSNIARLDDELNISFDTESLAEEFAACDNRADLGSPNNNYLRNHASRSSDLGEIGLSHNDVDNFISAYSGWQLAHQFAYGASTSLYECHPITKTHAGEPIADVFAICARENSSVLILGDGVNWGDRSRLAARCAVRGAMEYLSDHLYNEEKPMRNTLEIFHCLLQAFHAGHQLILQEGGNLTTLCAVVICPLRGRTDYVACACNVGDSLAFVYSEKHGVREITLASHDIQQMRDMRDAGGALGPVDGVNPELHNFTCSMTVVEKSDIVFITSDGVSDNFDPVVGKFCVIKEELEREKENLQKKLYASQTESGSSSASSTTNAPVPRTRLPSSPTSSRRPKKYSRQLSAIEDQTDIQIDMKLPIVQAHQRHELMLLRMEDLLRNGVTMGDPPTNSAQDLCENLINFSKQLTMAKRRILEDPDLYSADLKLKRDDQRTRRRLVRSKIAEMPGKLDHATVTGCTVGANFELPPPAVPSPLQPRSPELIVELNNRQTGAAASSPTQESPLKRVRSAASSQCSSERTFDAVLRNSTVDSGDTPKATRRFLFKDNVLLLEDSSCSSVPSSSSHTSSSTCKYNSAPSRKIGELSSVNIDDDTSQQLSFSGAPDLPSPQSPSLVIDIQWEDNSASGDQMTPCVAPDSTDDDESCFLDALSSQTSANTATDTVLTGAMDKLNSDFKVVTARSCITGGVSYATSQGLNNNKLQLAAVTSEALLSKTEGGELLFTIPEVSDTVENQLTTSATQLSKSEDSGSEINGIPDYRGMEVERISSLVGQVLSTCEEITSSKDNACYDSGTDNRKLEDSSPLLNQSYYGATLNDMLSDDAKPSATSPVGASNDAFGTAQKRPKDSNNSNSGTKLSGRFANTFEKLEHFLKQRGGGGGGSNESKSDVESSSQSRFSSGNHVVLRSKPIGSTGRKHGRNSPRRHTAEVDLTLLQRFKYGFSASLPKQRTSVASNGSNASSTDASTIDRWIDNRSIENQYINTVTSSVDHHHNNSCGATTDPETPTSTTATKGNRRSLNPLTWSPTKNIRKSWMKTASKDSSRPLLRETATEHSIYATKAQCSTMPHHASSVSALTQHSTGTLPHNLRSGAGLPPVAPRGALRTTTSLRSAQQMAVVNAANASTTESSSSEVDDLRYANITGVSAVIESSTTSSDVDDSRLEPPFYLAIRPELPPRGASFDVDLLLRQQQLQRRFGSSSDTDSSSGGSRSILCKAVTASPMPYDRKRIEADAEFRFRNVSIPSTTAYAEYCSTAASSDNNSLASPPASYRSGGAGPYRAHSTRQGLAETSSAAVTPLARMTPTQPTSDVLIGRPLSHSVSENEGLLYQRATTGSKLESTV